MDSNQKVTFLYWTFCSSGGGKETSWVWGDVFWIGRRWKGKIRDKRAVSELAWNSRDECLISARLDGV